MRGLFNRFANFMQGRYGTDKLNNALWVLLLILWFVNIFVWNRVARYIIDGIMLLVIVLICFRMFSRNIVARSAENRKFLPIYNAVTGWFKLTFKKIRDRKDYRYIKCPVCKAQLRVRNKKGNHTVRCPKCGSEFNKKYDRSFQYNFKQSSHSFIFRLFNIGVLRKTDPQPSEYNCSTLLNTGLFRGS